MEYDGINNFEKHFEDAKSTTRTDGAGKAFRRLLADANDEQSHRILNYLTSLNRSDAYYYIDKLNWSTVPDPIKREHLLNLVGDTNSETREYAAAQLLQSQPAIEGFPGEEPSDDLRDVFLKYGFPEYTQAMLDTDVRFQAYELYKAAEGGLYDAEVLRTVLESDRLDPTPEQCARALKRYIRACFSSAPKQRNTFDEVDHSDQVIEVLREHGLPFVASIDYSDELFDMLVEERHDVRSLPMVVAMASFVGEKASYDASINELFTEETTNDIPTGDLNAFYTYFSKTREPSYRARNLIDQLIQHRVFPSSDVMGEALKRDQTGSEYLRDNLPGRIKKSANVLSKELPDTVE